MSTTDRFAIGSYTAATGGRGDGITLVARDPGTGRLGRVLSVEPCDSPSFLAAAGGVLHAVHELDEGRLSTRRLSSRRLDGTGGELLIEVPTGGSSPCHVAVHPGAELLVVANYDGGLGVLDAPAGVPSGLTQTLQTTGSGPVAERQDTSRPHSAVWLDAGHVVVCDLGTDELRVHTAVAGRLSPDPVQVVTLSAGTGPRHAELRAGRVHVTGELDASLTSLTVRAGRLSDPVRRPALLTGVDGPVHPSEVTTTPWGLVVANRGADVLTLHEVTGGVAHPVRDLPLGARNPRHVAVVGNHVYVAAQDSDQVVHLALDADLTVVDRSVLDLGSPTCVLPLPRDQGFLNP